MTLASLEFRLHLNYIFREIWTDQNEIVNHLPVLNSNMEKIIF